MQTASWRRSCPPQVIILQICPLPRFFEGSPEWVRSSRHHPTLKGKGGGISFLMLDPTPHHTYQMQTHSEHLQGDTGIF